MKKVIILVLCVLATASLFASEFLDSFKDGKNYIPDNIFLSTGNDKFNYGITRNDDDQLSYSFDFKVEAPLWYVQFDANGFTDRGYREGWDMRHQDDYCEIGSHVVRGRYDSLETVVGLKLRPVENDFYLHIYPEIGFALVGDYGWEWGQNAVHRLLGIHEVDLPYEKDGVKTVRLMLDGRVNFGYKLLKFKRTSLIAEVEASTRNYIGFGSENQILGRISISTETHDLIGFHFGYMFADALEDDTWYTQDLYYRYLRGWRVGFTIDTGILFLKYTGTPESGFGYGYFGLDVMAFFEPKTWEETDAYLSFSKARFYGSFYNYITLGIPFGEKTAFVLKNAYLGGNPVNKKEAAGIEEFYGDWISTRMYVGTEETAKDESNEGVHIDANGWYFTLDGAKDPAYDMPETAELKLEDGELKAQDGELWTTFVLTEEGELVLGGEGILEIYYVRVTE